MVVPSSAIHGSLSPAGRVQRRPHLRPSLGENPYTGKSGLGRKPADPDAEYPRLKRDETALPPTHAQSEWARIACSLRQALPHSAKPVRSMFPFMILFVFVCGSDGGFAYWEYPKRLHKRKTIYLIVPFALCFLHLSAQNSYPAAFLFCHRAHCHLRKRLSNDPCSYGMQGKRPVQTANRLSIADRI